MHYFVGQGKKEAEKEECNRETESRKKTETRGEENRRKPLQKAQRSL